MRLVLTGLTFVFFFSCNNPTDDKTQAKKPSTVDTTKHKTKAPKTMDQLKDELSDEINSCIKSGFFNKDEIFEIILEMFYEETLDEAWIKQEIDQQYKKRLAEQATWEKKTDFDRLAQVFDILNSSGIIALHNSGYTRQDGEGDSRELHEELKAKGIKTKGYCFYHTQDMDRAIEGENLYLAFGDFEGNDESGLNIGKKIIASLQEKGIKTNWNNSMDTRIEVVGLKWQKRFGNENCSPERAISLLSKQ